MIGVMRIVVHGKPVPQGSVRSLGAGRPSVHGNADRLHPWRDSIITATQAAMVEYGWERGEGPCSVYGVFTFDRPKAHCSTPSCLEITSKYECKR